MPRATKKQAAQISHEQFNTLLALVAVIISGVSAWFSYYSYAESKLEKVEVKSRTIVMEDYPTNIYLFKPVNRKVEATITLFYELIISNNSDKKVSLVDIEGRYEDPLSGLVYYNRLYNGLYSDYTRRVEDPINLESGESRKLLINLGFMCDSTLSKILQKKFDKSTGYSLDTRIPVNYLTFLKVLITSKQGLNGSKVDGDTLKDGTIGRLSFTTDNRAPKINISFISSNGNVFKKEFHFP